MDKKALLKRLIYPPVWIILLLVLICAPLLVLVFLNGLEEHPIAYAVYVLSFYTVSVLSVYCARVLPAHYKKLRGMIYENKFGNRFMTDTQFRSQVSLNTSFVLNILYVAFNAVSGIVFGSAWFYVLSGYYAIMALMRFLTLRYELKNEIGKDMLAEWRRARVCSAILTLINISLSGAILMIMYNEKGFIYYGLLIYVVAAYTFYSTTIAIINVIKYRRYNSPVLSVATIITLTSALVSMLALETAMLTSFGADMSLDTKRLFIALTGAGISATVLSMSGYMIIKSTKEIRKLTEENK